jgi:hypothetical protein
MLDPEHRDTLTSMGNLAGALALTHDYPEAETVYRELIAARLRRDGADAASVAADRAGLGGSLIAQQKFAEAEPVLRESLVVSEKKMPDAWQTFNARSLLGGALAGQKKFAEAEPLLVSGYEGLKQREAKIPAVGKARIKEALERLVRLYTAWGQPEKAAMWQQQLDALNASASAPSEGK